MPPRESPFARNHQPEVIREVCRDRYTGRTFVVYCSWCLYMPRDVRPWMEQELGNFVRGVQASPERAGVSVTGALLRLAPGTSLQVHLLGGLFLSG